MTAKIQKQ